ncbi:hypothetical protein DL89DRAFT_26095 [Linderina pennispora]|uniref:Uncharacterized protein n=1 Tax=Linderina pennispora TaxID=61395 RepID=A0A1Y1WNC4_9FUNG|nr:uncharacterized protein DL89DRAFT_26095 [Linderina pennispora]ORX75023.1 hypothetical protein DL89DRAFT_26095 [Linderina pennispora]
MSTTCHTSPAEYVGAASCQSQAVMIISYVDPKGELHVSPANSPLTPPVTAAGVFRRGSGSNNGVQHMARSGVNPSAMPQPARYHGTNQPHSPYYAHGSASSPMFNYRGVTAPATRTAYATTSHGSRYSAGEASASATVGPAFLGSDPNAPRQHYPAGHARPGVRGMFEPVVTAAPTSGAWSPAQVPVTTRPMSATTPSRRTSISPVLTALQPAGYHIANLPDDGDSGFV